LQLALKTLIYQTTVPIKLCFLIDGLDEYEGNDADVAEIFSNAAISENIKICCSSRPHQVFQDAFAMWPGLKLEDLTYPDIENFVRDKLESNPRWKELKLEEPVGAASLVQEICTSASGVFLWVKLVVASLLSGLGSRDDVSTLEKRLRILPVELDGLYNLMIFKIDEVYREETSKLFQVVTCALEAESKDASLRSRSGAFTILTLSFAVEKDPTLVLTAEQDFLTKKQVLERCKRMEITVRTRSGGLIEVQYGHLDRYKVPVDPKMKVAYLHRTVQDYLERPETRRKLSFQTGGYMDSKSFDPNLAIVEAHILMLKALDSTYIEERPPQSLISSALHFARRAETKTQTSKPRLMDEFYASASLWWNRGGPPALNIRTNWQRTFFMQHKSMLTLATQCGLHRYLWLKLKEENIIATEYTDRSLLDWALIPLEGCEQYTHISVPVIQVLLEFGADPNKPYGAGVASGEWSSWQNMLWYLLNSGNASRLSAHYHAAIHFLLRNSNADPWAACHRPTNRYSKVYRKVVSDKGYSIDEIFSRYYGAESTKMMGQMLKKELEAARNRQKTEKGKKSLAKPCRMQ